MWILSPKVQRFSSSVQLNVTRRITLLEGIYVQLFTVVRQGNWERKNQSTKSTVDGSMVVNKITEQKLRWHWKADNNNVGEIHYNQNVLICLILKENGTGYPDNKNVYTFQVSYKHWASYKLFFTLLKKWNGAKSRNSWKTNRTVFSW